MESLWKATQLYRDISQIFMNVNTCYSYFIDFKAPKPEESVLLSVRKKKIIYCSLQNSLKSSTAPYRTIFCTQKVLRVWPELWKKAVDLQPKKVDEARKLSLRLSRNFGELSIEKYDPMPLHNSFSLGMKFNSFIVLKLEPFPSSKQE